MNYAENDVLPIAKFFGKKNFNPYPSLYSKINSRWFKCYNVKRFFKK